MPIVKTFFEVEVGRNKNVWVDNVEMSLKYFLEILPDYIAIGKPFRLQRACWRIQDREVNIVRNMIIEAKGKFV